MGIHSTNATIAPHVRRRALLALGVSCGALLVAAPAFAQNGAQNGAQTAAKPGDTDVVVITGFRGSLQTAINAKKKEDMIVDVIKSEDIAQFPDLNLAESMQRIPGVAIDRDGGEGRSITVRGLKPDFTRVRLNGLEAQATTGGKDSSGGANRGRGFDFNVFASDLFNSITVRKSLAAEIEEGSLGATVDLQTARPFDYKGFTMAGSYQASYNDLSKKSGGRGSFLISNRWADGKLGALVSVAYGANTVQEEGPNTTRWENAFSPSSVGRFASYSSNGGTTFTAIPASGTIADPEALKISNALHPRIPRYSRFVTDQKRLGMTGSFQMRPNPDTLISLDAMYAEYSANRDEYDLEAISFSRAGAGLPKTKIYNYAIDGEGTLYKGTFDNVDIRAEHRFDELKTTFRQLNLTWDQNIGDKLKMKLLVGASESFQGNPEQTTFTWDSYDVKGYSYDFTDSRNPVFNYGTSPTSCTVNQACYWSYSPNVTANATAAPGSGNGTTATTQGDASLIRIRPQSVDNLFSTTKIDFNYALNDTFTFKFGTSKKHYDFTSTELGRYTTNPATRDEAANNFQSAGLNALLNGDIAKYSTTVSLAGNTFLTPNLDLIRSTTAYDCKCVNSFGVFTTNATNSSSRTNNRDAHEQDTSSYVQTDFHHDIAGIPIRGNLGVRYVETAQQATGLVGKGSTSVLTTVSRKYSDTLPSLNVSAEPVDNLFVRFAASKTMSRPTLQSLSPGGSITTSTQTISVGNPYLNPIRANTLDLSFEWYPDKDSLYTISFFEKDIKTYIQTQVRSETFADLGFDTSLLSGTSPAQDGSTVYTVTQPINTPGGKLQGYEVNLQRPFTFLPGFLQHFGGILNYTHVDSKIQYVIASTATSVTYREANLDNMSKESWNATLYYEDGPFSGRVAVAHRSPYISIVLPGSGADFQGKNATTNVDAQATWKLNRNFTLVFEGLNLTDQYDDRNDQYNTAQGNTGQNLLLDYSHPGRQYYAGIRYKY
jgi:TonB-dependent receptor